MVPSFDISVWNNIFFSTILREEVLWLTFKVSYRGKNFDLLNVYYSGGTQSFFVFERKDQRNQTAQCSISEWPRENEYA